MATINARSPKYYSLSVPDLSSAELKLSIWNGDISAVPSSPQYTLKKDTIKGSILFEVAELISDFIDVDFNGEYNGKAVWVQSELTGFNSSDESISSEIKIDLALSSYTYFENPDEELPNPLMSNNEIFILAGEPFRIPFYVSDEDLGIEIIKDGVVLFSKSFTNSDFSSNKIQYFIVGDFNNSFKDRVNAEGGVVEAEDCIDIFYDLSDGVDAVKIYQRGNNKTIKIKTIEECKYLPKKITFINKYGAFQDMFFFKKSIEKLDVKRESYKANTIDSFGRYQTNQHTQRDFNVTGTEKITLNSGFLSEEYNEVFKQLMLSEKVWLTTDSNQVLPINIKSTNLKYKTSVNDRLVDYAIDFENSFNVINNIR